MILQTMTGWWRLLLVAPLVLLHHTLALAQERHVERAPSIHRVFNVRSYGAVGDGATDDTLAIQRAEQVAEAAAANIRGGATVHFPPGTYRLSADNRLVPLGSGYSAAIIIRASNITWTGEGASSVLYVDRWAPSTTIMAYVAVFNPVRDIENIEFRDIRLLSNYDVNNISFDTQVPAGFFQCGGTTATPNVKHCGFRNVYAKKIGGYAFNFDGGDANSSSGKQNFGAYVIDSTVTDSAYGGLTVFSGGVADCIFSRNRFYRVRGIGIESSCMRQVITENIFDTVLNSGFNTDRNSAQDGWNIIANNIFIEIGAHFSGVSSPCIALGESAGSLRFKVLGNVMRRCYGQGIAVSGATIEDIDISGNDVDGFAIEGRRRRLSINTGWSGIAAQGGTRVTVTSNRVRAPKGANDNAQYGITAGGTGGVDTWTDGNVTEGTFVIAPFITSCSAGAYGAGQNNRVGRNYDMTTGIAHSCFNRFNAEQPPTVPEGDVTPSLAGANTWLVSNTVPVTITGFGSGSIGETKTLVFTDTNTTISIASGNIFGNGGKNWSASHAYAVAKCTAVTNVAWTCVFGD